MNNKNIYKKIAKEMFNNKDLIINYPRGTGQTAFYINLAFIMANIKKEEDIDTIVNIIFKESEVQNEN